MQDVYLLAQSWGCFLNFVQLIIIRRHGRVEQNPDERGVRKELSEEPQPLSLHRTEQQIYPGGVAAGPVEAGDEALLDRIAAADEDDGRCCGHRLGSQSRGRAAGRSDHRRVAMNQIGSKRRQTVEMALRPAVFDPHVSALDEAGFMKPVSLRPRRNMSRKCPSWPPATLLRNPSTGIAGCCAGPASGHTAAPPKSAMKLRRLMQLPVEGPSLANGSVVCHSKIAPPLTLRVKGGAAI